MYRSLLSIPRSVGTLPRGRSPVGVRSFFAQKSLVDHGYIQQCRSDLEEYRRFAQNLRTKFEDSNPADFAGEIQKHQIARFTERDYEEYSKILNNSLGKRIYKGSLNNAMASQFIKGFAALITLWGIDVYAFYFSQFGMILGQMDDPFIAFTMGIGMLFFGYTGPFFSLLAGVASMEFARQEMTKVLSNPKLFYDLQHEIRLAKGKH